MAHFPVIANLKKFNMILMRILAQQNPSYLRRRKDSPSVNQEFGSYEHTQSNNSSSSSIKLIETYLSPYLKRAY